MWLYLPKTISRSLPAQQASTLDSASLAQRLAVSVSSRTKLMPPKYWQRVVEKGALTTALSGLTLDHSQATSSVAAWLELSGAFHVQTSPLLESKPESLTESTLPSGLNISESFAKCNLNGSLSRMSQQSSLFQQEELYCQGLPKQGSMRSGYLFERPTLELRTVDCESSSWPTARAEDSESCGNHPGAIDSLGGQRGIGERPE